MTLANSDAILELISDVVGEVAGVALTTGIPFSRLELAFKRGMIDAARAECLRHDPRTVPTVSRLSVLTGIHRREVKRLLETHPSSARGERLTVAATLVTRWMTSPQWLNERGEPRALPRRIDRDDILDFGKLARSVTTDVHPRTLLDELVRLDAVSIDPEYDLISLRVPAFVPGGDLDQLLAFSGANVADHVATVYGNLASIATIGEGDDAGTPFLEQALFADELNERTVGLASAEATREWLRVVRVMAPRLEALEAEDAASGRPATHRVRVGMYCYAEPVDRT